MIRPLLVLISCLLPAKADVEPTFYGKTVTAWTGVLQDKPSAASDRSNAIWALGCMGSKAKAATPALIAEVQSGIFPKEAVQALVSIGEAPEITVPFLFAESVKPGSFHYHDMFGFTLTTSDQLVEVGGPAVPDLLKLLQGPNLGLRVCAAEALGRIGPDARLAIPALLQAVEHPEKTWYGLILRRFAVEALGRIGPEAKDAVSCLTGLLGKKGYYNDDHLSDYDIAIAIDGIGAAPPPKLLECFLRDEDMFYVPLFARLAPKFRELVPALRETLNDKKLQRRLSAAVKLAYVEPAVVEAIPVLIEGLNHLDEDGVDERKVCEALARLGPKAKVAIPRLLVLANAEIHRPPILETLIQIDPEGKECLPTLISALQADGEKYEAHEFVSVAANCLGLLGTRAKAAVPFLAVALTREFPNDPSNHDSQVSAARTLQRIGPEAKMAIPVLISALQYRGNEDDYKDDATAAASAQTLGMLGEDAKAAVPALIEAIKTREKDENRNLRRAAILAIGQIGTDAKMAVPLLQGLMVEDGKDSPFQPELIVSLCRLSPEGKRLAEEWLQKPFGDRPWSGIWKLRRNAIVLGAMGRTSTESDWVTRFDLRSLDKSLAACRDPRSDEPRKYVEESLARLGSFGSAGRVAIPRLRELLTDRDPWIRMWAAESLAKILRPISP